MPSVPFTFNVHGTLEAAVKLQADTGIGQKELADRAAQAQAAESAALAAALGPTPLGSNPTLTQNPMQINATASGNYQQPNAGNPKANPAGTVSKSNPMGL